MPDAVEHVRRPGVIPQVFDAVVRRVTVVMANLHPVRAWTHKRLENQTMHPGHPPDAPTALAKVHTQVAVLPGHGLQDPPLHRPQPTLAPAD